MPLLVRAAIAVLLGSSGNSPTVFVVTKSENRNEVHYAVRLDASCSPVGDTPAFAYWRMRERGEAETEPLLGMEEPAYGIAWQKVIERRDGGSLRLALRAVPSRVIRVDAWRGPSGCEVAASTTVAGVAAELERVHVVLGFFGVDHLELLGRARGGGTAVREEL